MYGKRVHQLQRVMEKNRSVYTPSHPYTLTPSHPHTLTPSQMALLQVELPKGERTVVRVSPTITMSALLHYICEKRNIAIESHYFDLPATEESIANRTLRELGIDNIRVLTRGVCVCVCVCVCHVQWCYLQLSRVDPTNHLSALRHVEEVRNSRAK